jgi:hypothetical protein
MGKPGAHPSDEHGVGKYKVLKTYEDDSLMQENSGNNQQS